MKYKSFNEEMRRRFGCKVYKLSVDGGFTCPNRDGTIGYGGCVFCSRGGSGDFAAHGSDIISQLNEAKNLVENKNKGGKYIAYFQSYTGTYASVDRLKELFYPAILEEDIVALDVATRPDCLEDEKIQLLKELSLIKPIWIELGLQTIHEKTAIAIRRGYNLDVYVDAVKRLKDAGIEVITHMIIGLPGETIEDMKATARFISDIGSDGIKLQLLHVLKNTYLEKAYFEGEFEVMSLEDYCVAVKECLSVLREDIVVHRITGDGAKKDLIAPLWSGDKKRVLNELKKVLLI